MVSILEYVRNRFYGAWHKFDYNIYFSTKFVNNHNKNFSILYLVLKKYIIAIKILKKKLKKL